MKDNNVKITIIIIILFILYYLYRGRMCPCPNHLEGNNCHGLEFYGLQINHLIFYFFIGYLFPTHFFTWQLLGFIWELLEFIPSYYPNILPYLGGCIEKSKINDYYINILDRGIPRNKYHFWHPKLSDLVLNLIGFGIGYILKNNKFNKRVEK